MGDLLDNKLYGSMKLGSNTHYYQEKEKGTKLPPKVVQLIRCEYGNVLRGTWSLNECILFEHSK